eukprot:7766974-Lingulodinium_polyedra.AAC.1
MDRVPAGWASVDWGPADRAPVDWAPWDWTPVDRTPVGRIYSVESIGLWIGVGRPVGSAEPKTTSPCGGSLR